MKKTSMILLPVLAIGLSCSPDLPNRKTTTTDTSTSSEFVSRDSANKMISSYINSISYTETDTNLISVSLDAAQLKQYLLSDSTITGVKISLGHTLSYINAGGLNVLCGYKNTALTMIVSCYDEVGNYKFYSGGAVMDFATLCPNNCPPGSAGSPLFTTNIATDE